MYIKIYNLIINMTILIHSPSLHNKVDSGSYHEDGIRNLFAVRVAHTSGQGGYSCLSVLQTGPILDPSLHADSACGLWEFQLLSVAHDVLRLLYLDPGCPRV
jgi:hypothetical protein